MPLDPAGVPSRAGIQAAIDEVTANPGWTALVHEGTSGTLRYCVVSGWVQIEGTIAIALPTSTAVTLLAAGNALPAAHRPTLSLNLAIARLNTNVSGIISRLTNGTISVTNPGAAATSLQFAYSYPLG